jgi:hypothetical protein
MGRPVSDRQQALDRALGTNDGRAARACAPPGQTGAWARRSPANRSTPSTRPSTEWRGEQVVGPEHLRQPLLATSGEDRAGPNAPARRRTRGSRSGSRRTACQIVTITAVAGPRSVDQRRRSQSGGAIVPTVVARASASATTESSARQPADERSAMDAIVARKVRRCARRAHRRLFRFPID